MRPGNPSTNHAVKAGSRCGNQLRENKNHRDCQLQSQKETLGREMGFAVSPPKVF